MALPSVPITDQLISFSWQQWAERVDQTVESVRTVGSTANRPTAKFAYLGMRYFDKGLGTVGKPIYAAAISPTAVTWVDSTGAVV